MTRLNLVLWQPWMTRACVFLIFCLSVSVILEAAPKDDEPKTPDALSWDALGLSSGLEWTQSLKFSKENLDGKISTHATMAFTTRLRFKNYKSDDKGCSGEFIFDKISINFDCPTFDGVTTFQKIGDTGDSENPTKNGSLEQLGGNPGSVSEDSPAKGHQMNNGTPVRGGVKEVTVKGLDKFHFNMSVVTEDLQSLGSFKFSIKRNGGMTLGWVDPKVFEKIILKKPEYQGYLKMGKDYFGKDKFALMMSQLVMSPDLASMKTIAKGDVAKFVTKALIPDGFLMEAAKSDWWQFRDFIGALQNLGTPELVPMVEDKGVITYGISGKADNTFADQYGVWTVKATCKRRTHVDSKWHLLGGDFKLDSSMTVADRLSGQGNGMFKLTMDIKMLPYVDGPVADPALQKKMASKKYSTQ